MTLTDDKALAALVALTLHIQEDRRIHDRLVDENLGGAYSAAQRDRKRRAKTMTLTEMQETLERMRQYNKRAQALGPILTSRSEAEQRLANAKDHLICAQQYLHWVRKANGLAELSTTLHWAVKNFYLQLDNVWACQCMVRGEGAGL